MSEITYYLLGGIIAVLVLVGISLMRKVTTARLGNLLNAVATVFAVVLVLVYHGIIKSGLHGLIIIFGGMAIGAAAGAIGGHFTKIGIDDDFIDAVREKVTPGTSALFLMSANAVVDRVVKEFEDLKDVELISTNLSEEQEAQLRAAFAEEE